jgi:hypothetical protein
LKAKHVDLLARNTAQTLDPDVFAGYGMILFAMSGH